MDGAIPLLFIGMAVVVWMISRVMDEGRVKSYIEGRGGHLLEKQWTPFGRGWYGDTNRIYTVRYLDAQGNEHLATCKTSLLSGVYFTEDDIVRRAEGAAEPDSLAEENARLKREIERLKRDRTQPGSRS